MSGNVIPDYIAAVVAELRARPSVTAAVPAERIATHLPDSADMPESWVIVRGAGGPGRRDNLPVLVARFDVQTYATNGYEAMRLAQLVASALVPLRGSSRIHRHDCVIGAVERESAFLPLSTPREGWPFVAVSYLGYVMEEAIPA